MLGHLVSNAVYYPSHAPTRPEKSWLRRLIALFRWKI
jgi:hypothetical protein